VLRKVIAIATGLLLTAGGVTLAQQPSNEDLRREIEALRQRLQELEKTLAGPKQQALEAGHSTKWKVSGYVQGQYQRTGNTGEGDKNDDQFSVRRARLTVETSLSKSSSFLLQLDASSAENKVSVKDASFTHAVGEGAKLTVGQRKWNWGFENLQSSSYRLFPERSLTNLTFFPGERDRGLYFEGKTKDEKPLYWSVGVWNGNGTSDKDFTKNDPNDEKDLCLRLSNLDGYKYHGPAGQFNWQLSVYVGKQHGFNAAGTERDFTKRRVGLAGQYFYESVPEENGYAFREGSAIRAEVQFGKGWVGSAFAADTGAAKKGQHQWVEDDAEGGYLEASKILDPEWDLVGRYQLFDPDNGPKQKIVEAALVHYLDELSKVTLAYEVPNVAAGDKTKLTLRFQHNY